MSVGYSKDSYQELLKAKKTASKVEREWLASIGALAKNLPKQETSYQLMNDELPFLSVHDL